MGSNAGLAQAADLVDREVGTAWEAVRRAPDRGEWESTAEANFLLGLIVRHAEAVAALARVEVGLYPSAMTVARAAYEAAIRALWLLHPSDEYERERRWLSHLWDTEEYYERFAKRLERLGADAAEYRSVASTISSFRQAVTASLPDGTKAPKQMPDFAAMLDSLGDPAKYLVYMATSQYVHGSQVATGLYRRNLGTEKQSGEFISTSDWQMPLKMVWFAVEEPTARLLECVGGAADAFRSRLPRSEMAGALDRLATEG